MPSVDFTPPPKSRTALKRCSSSFIVGGSLAAMDWEKIRIESKCKVGTSGCRAGCRAD